MVATQTSSLSSSRASAAEAILAAFDLILQYMRRQTCTINYGTDLPLAQGVRFDVEG